MQANDSQDNRQPFAYDHQSASFMATQGRGNSAISASKWHPALLSDTAGMSRPPTPLSYGIPMTPVDVDGQFVNTINPGVVSTVTPVLASTAPIMQPMGTAQMKQSNMHGTPATASHHKPKRRQVKAACGMLSHSASGERFDMRHNSLFNYHTVNCRKSCKRCEEVRPCARCVRLNMVESCVDHTRKTRKSPASVSTAATMRRASVAGPYYRQENIATVSRGPTPVDEASFRGEGNDSRLSSNASGTTMDVNTATLEPVAQQQQHQPQLTYHQFSKQQEWLQWRQREPLLRQQLTMDQQLKLAVPSASTSQPIAQQQLPPTDVHDYCAQYVFIPDTTMTKTSADNSFNPPTGSFRANKPSRLKLDRLPISGCALQTSPASAVPDFTGTTLPPIWHMDRCENFSSTAERPVISPLRSAGAVLSPCGSRTRWSQSPVSATRTRAFTFDFVSAAHNSAGANVPTSYGSPLGFSPSGLLPGWMDDFHSDGRPHAGNWCITPGITSPIGADNSTPPSSSLASFASVEESEKNVRGNDELTNATTYGSSLQ